MMKWLKVSILLICMVAITILFVFIDNHMTVDLVVLSYPNKDWAYIGEDLDMQGMQIGLLKKDDQIVHVDLHEVQFHGYDSSFAHQNRIIISYKQFETFIDIEIIERPTLNKRITSIEMHTLPNKRIYFLGETIDLTGASIRRNYNDDTFDIISITRHDIEGFNSDAVEFEQEIIVKYLDTQTNKIFETSFYISIVESD
ncbi:bacterial Ig-like domain-containing protein [Acholeplasma equifetale]|uniref:bacterial Ig-like domain-containing protein n=1 Tax=Acholeplasma equifetale TaxID=264634 RepID=UPI00047BEA19|nr:bacterial Ig-like domain-containing protein [Acholeplasma equifetale]